MSTAISLCPACGSATTSHCPTNPAADHYSHTCTWWRCTNCFTYGDDNTHVRDDRRRGVIG